MKRILSFLGVIIVLSISSCGTVKPVNLVQHESSIACVYTKPVTVSEVDTNDLIKQWLIEVYTPQGGPGLAWVKSKTMYDVVHKLEWPFNQFVPGASTRGNAFTCYALGEDSRITENDLESGKFDDQQKELLKRFNNRVKYELLSILGPITAKAYVIDNKYVPIMDNITTPLNKNQPPPKQTPPPPPKKSSWLDGLKNG